MRIKTLDLKNFRTFDRLPIQFHERLTLLVGKNGSGKTSILESIVIGLNPILTRLPLQKKPKRPRLSASDITQISSDNIASYARISLTACLDANTDIRWDRTRKRDNSAKTRNEIPKGVELKELYRAIDEIVDAHNEDQPYRLPVFACYGTSRAVDVPHYRVPKRTLPKFFRRLAGLEEATEAKTDFRRAVAWFDFLEQQELRQERDSGLPSQNSHLDSVKLAIRRTVPGVTNPRIDASTGRFVVDVDDACGRSIKLQIDQLSDGYQVILGVVIDFALRLALVREQALPAEDVLATEALLMIDEIDLHLHPSWQKKVVGSLRDAFPNTQLILTTHSPQVVSTVPSECIRILENGRVHGAPRGTEGAEAQRMLQTVFGESPRSIDLKPVRKLSRYLQLVNERKWESSEAIELRKWLDNWSGGNEPSLLEADLRIDNMKWEASLEKLSEV